MASVDQNTKENLNSRAELPKKYKSLLELFTGMLSSHQLLKMKGQPTIFHNIRRQVKELRKREFSYKDLGQIKFIVPDIVKTKKISVHNKMTLIVQRDIEVDVVKGHNNMALSKIFSNRLLELVNKHSEDFDVPEAELGEPFNQREIKVAVSETEPCLVCDKPGHNAHDCLYGGSGTSDMNMVNTEIADKVEDTSENDVITQSGLKAFQPTSDCLTHIVKTIHYVSRSTQCSFITQSELFYKILVDNLDIVEREEIEEHLEVLVNKAPNWITKKVDLSGGTLYYFNKGLSLKSVTDMLT